MLLDAALHLRPVLASKLRAVMPHDVDVVNGGLVPRNCASWFFAFSLGHNSPLNKGCYVTLLVPLAAIFSPHSYIHPTTRNAAFRIICQSTPSPSKLLPAMASLVSG